MRFVIVCDFPVPGGPYRMNVVPFPASNTAAICEESTGTGRERLSGVNVLSSSFRFRAIGFGVQVSPPFTRLSTTGFSTSLSLLT